VPFLAPRAYDARKRQHPFDGGSGQEDAAATKNIEDAIRSKRAGKYLARAPHNYFHLIVFSWQNPKFCMILEKAIKKAIRLPLQNLVRFLGENIVFYSELKCDQGLNPLESSVIRMRCFDKVNEEFYR